MSRREVRGAQRVGRHVRRVLGLGGLLAGLVFLSGCSFTRPTLKAAAVRSVPFPNGRIETAIWNQAPEIIVPAYRRIGGQGEKRRLKLRAIHDGQALSILATWMDMNESIQHKSWVWIEEKNDYHLASYAVDQLSIQWPLSENPSFCMLGKQPEKYDLWTWRAAWTNFSGYADDGVVEILPHPLGTKPADVQGALYPRQDGRGLVEVRMLPDSGTPATSIRPKPTTKREPRAPTVATDHPRGSAGDVQAYGVYSPEIIQLTNPDQQIEDSNTPGYWYRENFGRYREASWFVEFYRLFKTATPSEDYQIDPAGENLFALAIHDASEKAEHFTTGPIRLKLAKLKPL